RYFHPFPTRRSSDLEAIAAGTPIALSLTTDLNNVTSSNASRLAVYQERLPWSIVFLLFLASVVPAFLVGEKQSASQKVHASGTIDRKSTRLNSSHGS